jgi:thiol oxidase
MRGFVEHFFGCADCAAHFLSMAASKSDPMPQPASSSDWPAAAAADAAVLWLWRAHNQVNARLNATGTRLVLRQGLHKVQFPSAQRCPQCSPTADKWDVPLTLKYLRRTYCQDEVGVVSCRSLAA